VKEEEEEEEGEEERCAACPIHTHTHTHIHIHIHTWNVLSIQDVASLLLKGCMFFPLLYQVNSKYLIL